MYLRKLEEKDAPLMLEWMHDEDVVRFLNTDFSKKTIEDCRSFINNAQEIGKDAHYAISSDEDEYMGTVSLKNINRMDNSAEFAVTVRKCSMTRGYSWFGMEAVIEKGFNELDLEAIYWCVDRNNFRAVRFYDKHNFHEVVDVPQDILDRYKGKNNLKWYSVLKGDVLDERTEVAGCKVIHIRTIPTINAGELSFFEETYDFPYAMKRMYYISKVPEGMRRGFHAHKRLKQLLYCPYGRIQLILENEEGREEIELSDPSIGVIIDKPTWREMLWLQKDSVLCVAASEYYSAEDYIREYDDFKEYISNKDLRNGNTA